MDAAEIQQVNGIANPIMENQVDQNNILDRLLEQPLDMIEAEMMDDDLFEI